MAKSVTSAPEPEVVGMAEKIEGPALVMFTCQCGRRLEALPSAEVRCKCGKQMVREADRAAGKQLAGP